MFIKFIHCIKSCYVVLYHPKRANAYKKNYISYNMFVSVYKTNGDITVLAKSFIEDLGDAILNLASKGF